MKIKLIHAAFVVPALLLWGITFTFAQPKGDTVTIKGEVVDLWCYLEGGDHGAEHKKCATARAKAGNPIGLLTEKGDLYVMMGLEDHQPGKDVLIEKMASVLTNHLKNSRVCIHGRVKNIPQR